MAPTEMNNNVSSMVPDKDGKTTPDAFSSWQRRLKPPPQGGSSDAVVVSGMSGRFPEAGNIEELAEKLFAGVDMVTENDRRWKPGFMGLPKRSGTLKDIKSFDASFFGVHGKQAGVMDPRLRLLMELCYEAIVDAGVNPELLRGSRTGVFVGASNSESETAFNKSTDAEAISGYTLTGTNRSMFSNRISFAFDFIGPSFTIDSDCSSSMMAFQQGFSAIKRGECDAAIVAGANVCLSPQMGIGMQKMDVLSPDGACKVFDKSANGFARSEAAVAVLLQRASVSRRVYATVLNAKTNNEGSGGSSCPIQKQLLREAYAEVEIDPSSVVYIEADAPGLKEKDQCELRSITEVFCNNRRSPLLVGSIKSNIGHTEAASGLCSLVKVLIGMERGVIVPNLHFTELDPNMQGILEARLEVVKNVTPIQASGIVGLNNFGLGGSNIHVVLQGPPDTNLSDEEKPKIPDIPYQLINFSGRTEAAVERALEILETSPIDEAQVSLIQEVFSTTVPGHNYRGFAILGAADPARCVSQVLNVKRPVWFCYSGIGSQWAGMAVDLLKIPAFDKAVRKCCDALIPYDFDVYNMILNADKTDFGDQVKFGTIIPLFQVAMTDLLMNSLGVLPDGILGHSAGELSCGYADGSLTLEQTVGAAFVRARSFVTAKVPLGAMASVGLSWIEAQKQCPPTIYLACHNSADNVTISGPVEDIKNFVEQLKAEGIFAREVNTGGTPFHCQYVAKARAPMMRALQTVIPLPKPRSPKWISSSVPEADWGTKSAQLSSAEYHANNMLSPVLFHEALQHIPENAIVIEIAPHAALQPILKRSLAGKGCSILPLQRRDAGDNLHFFLRNIGQLYVLGGPAPKLSNLFRDSFSQAYPVPRGTRGISSLMEWDHSAEWNVPTLEQYGFVDVGGPLSDFKANISLEPGTEYAHVAGHKIDGRVLFPATGYLFLAWKAMARSVGVPVIELPVEFRDVHFHRATILNADAGPATLSVSLLSKTGKWEVSHGNAVVASGVIVVPEDKTQLMYGAVTSKDPSEVHDCGLRLSQREVYMELGLRGYEYGEDFRGILKATLDGRSGKLAWKSNWIAFMDTMLQLALLSKTTRSLELPTRIQYMKILPGLLMKAIEEENEGESEVHVFYDSDLQVCLAGGIEIRGIKTTVAPRRPPSHGFPTLESYTLYEFFPSKPQNASCVQRGLLEIVLQNVTKSKLNFAQFLSEETESPIQASDTLAVRMKEVAERMPSLHVDCFLISPTNSNLVPENQKCTVILSDEKLPVEEYDLLIVNSLEDPLSKKAFVSVASGGFLVAWPLATEGEKATLAGFDRSSFIQIASLPLEGNPTRTANLFRKVSSPTLSRPVFIKLEETDTFSWVQSLKKAAEESQRNKDNCRLWITCDDDPLSGIVGLTTCMRKEPGLEVTRCLFSNKGHPLPMDSDDKSDEFIQGILAKDLSMNFLQQRDDGTWTHGTFIHKDLWDPQAQRPTAHAYLNATVKGDLSSLAWIESPLGIQVRDGEVLCNVHYAPLNFRDIMLATGKLSSDSLPGNLAQQECVLGLEFAGREAKTGRRVMGLVPAQGMATTVLADPDFMWTVPEAWSLKEASTIPVVYATVYYALILRGRLKPGETVLIHAGSGGVGQAAIQIALSMGCKVFTTVGSQEKRDFLKERFQALNDSCIGNSRDAISFEGWIMRQTKGRGVNVALNSLAGDKLLASIRCVAEHGRFLEIGKVDLSENTQLGMAVFLKNIAFHGILLDALFERLEEKRSIAKLIKQGIESGVVKPLPASIFHHKDCEDAFRYMAAGKHMGKVVLEVQPEGSLNGPCKSAPVLALSRAYCKPQSVYLITGGLGGFGLELARWLVSKGARKLVLTSRSGIKTGLQRRVVSILEGEGARVHISTANIGTKEGAETLVNECTNLGLLAGIFHLAAVIRDGILENLTPEEFKEVYSTKARGLVNIDHVSRERNLTLDWFVAFSSISCGRGNAGQANYGLANSVLERICEQRKKDGLAGLAIQWGAIGDVGLVVNKLGSNDVVIGGSTPQRISSCLRALETFLCMSRDPDAPAVVASTVWAKREGSAIASAAAGPAKNDVCQQIAKIIGLPDISPGKEEITLGDLGMDSLMVVEVRQVLERECDLCLGIPEVRQLTFKRLQELQAR